jgi:hypothetical protein
MNDESPNQTNVEQESVSDSGTQIDSTKSSGKWKPGSRGRPPKWATGTATALPIRDKQVSKSNNTAKRFETQTVDAETLRFCVGTLCNVVDSYFQKVTISTLKRKGFEESEIAQIVAESKMTEGESEAIKSNASLILSRYNLAKYGPELALSLACLGYASRQFMVFAEKPKPKKSSENASD